MNSMIDRRYCANEIINTKLRSSCTNKCFNMPILPGGSRKGDDSSLHTV